MRKRLRRCSFPSRLVSTIGFRSSNRKITRKEIQEVDVKKACQTILQPKAPIALRLQGSLLYGLSRVYSQQCHYVLTDAERVQAHMRAFYSALGGSDNALDPQAGKSRPKDLILPDDPEFELTLTLPVLHFDDEGNLVVPQSSQASRKTSSQLSPVQADASLSSSNRSFLGGFDLSQSPFGREKSLVQDPFAADTMTPGKGGDGLIPFGDEERQLQAFGDWGLEIDADGNVIPTVEEPEPELPQLPRLDDEEAAAVMHQDEFIQFDNQGDVIMSREGAALSSDPPIPRRQEQEQEQGPEREKKREQDQEQEVAMEDEVNFGQAPVRAQRQRRRRFLAPDDRTKISRQEIKAWSANYLANAEQAAQPRHGTTAAEARKNAFHLIFGRGIAGVGLPTGAPDLSNPLALHFAGEGLQACLLGIIVERRDGGEGEVPRGGRRRRSALEALELEEEDAERRVRRRLSGESDEDHQHAGQSAEPLLQPDDALLPTVGDDEVPPVEVGRRAGSALPDLPSDLPWNRPSSQIPSSSVKGGSRPPSRQVSASPLHGRSGRGTVIPAAEIERFSDQPAFGSDGLGSEGFFAPLHSGGAAAHSPFSSDPITLSQQDAAAHKATSQAMRDALDLEGRNFLGFVEAVARERGYCYPSDDDEEEEQEEEEAQRRRRRRQHWVDFEELFEAGDKKRGVVAQAFYHVLSLATKNVIGVRQDGQEENRPFGTIRLGVEVPDGGGDEEEGLGRRS
ncbi:hypothetical protein VTK56DRAFT_2202 [Thermocarpiscus australiensis]